jgi:addiction module RelB/DinJ family antitoxin
MSNKTVISVKVDKDVRNKARKLSKEIGVPLSMVVNRKLQQFVEERRIEFEVPLIPNAKTKKILDKALQDVAHGRKISGSHTFPRMKDALEWLEKPQSR